MKPHQKDELMRLADQAISLLKRPRVPTVVGYKWGGFFPVWEMQQDEFLCAVAGVIEELKGLVEEKNECVHNVPKGNFCMPCDWERHVNETKVSK